MTILGQPDGVNSSARWTEDSQPYHTQSNQNAIIRLILRECLTNLNQTSVGLDFLLTLILQFVSSESLETSVAEATLSTNSIN